MRFAPPIALIGATLAAASIPAYAQQANPILEELRPQLQALVSKQAPDAVWELKGNELTASYKTRAYTIHSIRSDGSVEAQPHQELGPQNGGFLLRARVFSQLPAFAVPKSSGIRQAYWRGTMVRYNLRAEDNLDSIFSEPKTVQTEMVSETNDRIEFSEVPIASSPYIMLQRVDKTGLFVPSPFRGIGIWKVVPTTRYSAAVALARLLEEKPDLVGNRASRLKALQNATQKTELNLSGEELDALDNDLRELQSEFANEIARLSPKITTDLKAGEVIPEVFLPFKAQYLVFSLSQGLTQNVLPTETLLKMVNDWVKEKNKIADNK